MDISCVSLKLKLFWSAVLVVGSLEVVFAASNEQYWVEDGNTLFEFEANIVTSDMDQQRVRVRRAAAAPASVAAGAGAVPGEEASAASTTPPVPAPAPPAIVAPTNTTATTNTTNTNSAQKGGVMAGSTVPPTPPAGVAVTQTPLLGANGTGILRVNLTEHTPKVSDPIVPDDNFTDMFVETPERIKAEHNITNLTVDNHSFYNSTFIGNETYFEEYWRNISAGGPTVHPVLSNSHRRATTLQLSFGFPFYGSVVRNITVATGGFIYTGEHVHNWLAATQYIAPLMANFDTSRTNHSLVKLIDDGSRFSAFWENVTLQEESDAAFTFAVTLYKNGDIVFAYRRVPIDVQAIDDARHPVKVGISDAYLNDNIMFYVRRKTIYEYHRVNLKDHAIGNHTLLRLSALPTCLQYRDCAACLSHDTAFNCSWCPQLQKCSSGTDRNKQDWKIRNCERTAVRSASACAAPAADTPAGVPGVAGAGDNTVYATDADAAGVHDTHIDTMGESTARAAPAASASASSAAVVGSASASAAGGGGAGGAVAACLVLAVAGALVWVLYAFKNPHTRSGQILIKYRPSQWSWKRGEARYTAATIHM